MANQILLDILLAGPEKWNTWRATQPDQPLADLTKVELNGFDFCGYELHHVDFSGAQLREVNLTGVLLGAAKLDDADLTDALLDGVIFSQSTLQRAILCRVRCSQRAYMSTADFTGANLTSAQIQKAGLWGANFTDADLTDAVFKECDMNCSTFVRTNLTNSVLTASLSESRFPGALLVNTLFDGRFFYRVSFADADLSRIHPDSDFANIRFHDANFVNANLTGCRFDNALLSGSVFVGANLRNCLFRSAQLGPSYGLAKARLAGADFTGAQFGEGADLAGVDFSNVNLSKAILPNVILTRADFTGAILTDCQFPGAQLDHAILRHVQGVGANFKGANLTGADMSDSDFSEVQLRSTNLTDARLYNTRLEYAMMVKANVAGAHFVQASVYGLANWDMIGKPARQQNLVITQPGDNTITVNDLQVAQIVYTLLRRENFTPLIDTLTSKAVLILGRFSPERKRILDALADALSQHDLLPILFDFTGPASRGTEETVKILAGLSKFVIVDITEPKSSPLELRAIAPDLQVPIFPLIEKGDRPFSMLPDLNRSWVEKLDYYTSEADAVSKVASIIARADHLNEQIKETRAAYFASLEKLREEMQNG